MWNGIPVIPIIMGLLLFVGFMFMIAWAEHK